MIALCMCVRGGNWWKENRMLSICTNNLIMLLNYCYIDLLRYSFHGMRRERETVCGMWILYVFLLRYLRLFFFFFNTVYLVSVWVLFVFLWEICGEIQPLRCHYCENISDNLVTIMLFCLRTLCCGQQDLCSQCKCDSSNDKNNLISFSRL